MDYTKKPFYLSQEDIAWVEETFASMTQEEKLNQVFMDVLWNASPKEVEAQQSSYQLGGLDLAMVPIYINTYNGSREALRQTVAKIMEKSNFKGTSPVDAFCDRSDTRL